MAFQNSLYQNEEFLRHASAPDIFMMSDYPPVFISTTPSDSIIYEDTHEIHTLLESLKIDHFYKEYNPTVNKLDHVFNVLFPQYEESIQANEDILDYFKTMICFNE